MPGVRGMLAKALIAAFLGVLIGGALVLSGSLREPDAPPAPIELRDSDGGRERKQAPASRQPQHEPGRPTAPVPDPPAAPAPVPTPAESDSVPAPVAPPSSLPDEGDDDDGGDDEGDDELDDDDD